MSDEHDTRHRKVPEENTALIHALANLCAFLHYSHSENEKEALASKGVARNILKGRMFEDTQILEALEELRVKGRIELRRYEDEER